MVVTQLPYYFQSIFLSCNSTTAFSLGSTHLSTPGAFFHFSSSLSDEGVRDKRSSFPNFFVDDKGPGCGAKCRLIKDKLAHFFLIFFVKLINSHSHNRLDFVMDFNLFLQQPPDCLTEVNRKFKVRSSVLF